MQESKTEPTLGATVTQMIHRWRVPLGGNQADTCQFCRGVDCLVTAHNKAYQNTDPVLPQHACQVTAAADLVKDARTKTKSTPFYCGIERIE